MAEPPTIRNHLYFLHKFLTEYGWHAHKDIAYNQPKRHSQLLFTLFYGIVTILRIFVQELYGQETALVGGTAMVSILMHNSQKVSLEYMFMYLYICSYCNSQATAHGNLAVHQQNSQSGKYPNVLAIRDLLVYAFYSGISAEPLGVGKGTEIAKLPRHPKDLRCVYY